jgi:DNA repair protein RAD16
VCHIEISIDLEQEAVEMEEDAGRKARQGILSRLNLDVSCLSWRSFAGHIVYLRGWRGADGLQNWRSSSKLEALVEELEKLRNQDCTIKSLVL